jgi:hypothetical protein
MIIFGNRLDLYDDPTYSGTTRQSGEADANKLGELEGGMEWIRKAGEHFHSLSRSPLHRLMNVGSLA